jgi:hypothetical protein
MDMAKRLAKEFNKPVNTAASQKDEPGGTLGPSCFAPWLYM